MVVGGKEGAKSGTPTVTTSDEMRQSGHGLPTLAKSLLRGYVCMYVFCAMGT